MMRRDSGQVLQRKLRKQDLLLASTLARGQVVGSFNQLAEQADAVVHRVVKVRRWLSNPLLWMAGSAAGVVVLGVALRRKRGLRVATVALRWGWLAWRLWRSTGPALAGHRHHRSAG